MLALPNVKGEYLVGDSSSQWESKTAEGTVTLDNMRIGLTNIIVAESGYYFENRHLKVPI
jgi:hypothetical protein